MLSARSLQFDAIGWTEVEQSENVIKWTNSYLDLLSIHLFLIPPDLPGLLSDIHGLRDSYRALINQGPGGGLISADILSVQLVPCIKTVFKVLQEPSGVTYIGSLTYPFAESTYVIKVQCGEAGITGMRETAVLSPLLADGTFKIDLATNTVPGWVQDPYDPAFVGPVVKNYAEDEKFDPQFPNHPLTRARTTLSNIVNTLFLDADILTATPYRGD